MTSQSGLDLPGRAQPRQGTVPCTDQCLVMGILNVTPDSFSDGGLYHHTAAAVAHGKLMWELGADYVDVGGESTRPGAGRVDVAEELRRVVPVVERLALAGIAVSIDTTRAAVAEAALAAGAALVNDVSGGLADPAMARVVATAQVPWVLNHSRGTSHNMYAAAVPKPKSMYCATSAILLLDTLHSTRPHVAARAGTQRFLAQWGPGAAKTVLCVASQKEPDITGDLNYHRFQINQAGRNRCSHVVRWSHVTSR